MIDNLLKKGRALLGLDASVKLSWEEEQCAINLPFEVKVDVTAHQALSPRSVVLMCALQERGRCYQGHTFKKVAKSFQLERPLPSLNKDDHRTVRFLVAFEPDLPPSYKNDDFELRWVMQAKVVADGLDSVSSEKTISLPYRSLPANTASTDGASQFKEVDE